MDEYTNAPAPLPEEPAGYSPKQSFSRVGWTYFTVLAVSEGLIVLAKFLAPKLLESSWSLLLISILPLYLVAVPIGWCILRRLPAARPEEHALTGEQLLMYFVMSFAVMYLGNLVGVGVNTGISAAFGGSYENPISELLGETNIWAELVCVVLIAPPLEELLFRKLLCDRIRVYGEKTAIVVSGLVFGLFHANLYQFFYAFGVGMLFSYIYLRTGRLRYTMLLHMSINLVGGVLPAFLLQRVDLDAISGLSTDDMPALLAYVQSHMAEMLGFGLFVITVFALFILGVVFLLLRRKQAILLPAEKELPKQGRGGVVFGNAGMICYLILTCGLMAATAVIMALPLT